MQVVAINDDQLPLIPLDPFLVAVVEPLQIINTNTLLEVTSTLLDMTHECRDAASDCDAYVNIAGGIKMTEPGIDLGIVLAIMSSKMDFPIEDRTICFGEVGLSGEVRGVSMAEQSDCRGWQPSARALILSTCRC